MMGDDAEDKTSDIQCGVLGFCACGQPEENLQYILGGLEIINAKMERCDDFERWWKDREKREVDHFKSPAARNFFYYWCDKEGLTQHGGSIPGWLDNKGKALLETLREWARSESAV